jgi:hypothetical protein
MAGILDTVKSFVAPLRTAVESAASKSGLGFVSQIKTSTGLTLHPLDRLIAMRGSGTLGAGGSLARNFMVTSRAGYVPQTAIPPPSGFKTIGYGR